VLLSLAVSQRDRPEFRESVGYMMNEIWINYKSDVECDYWDAFVSTCNDTLIKALSHAVYPLPLVARATGIEGMGGEAVSITVDTVPDMPDLGSSTDSEDEKLKLSIVGGSGQVPINNLQFVPKYGSLFLNYRAENFAGGNFDAPNFLLGFKQMVDVVSTSSLTAIHQSGCFSVRQLQHASANGHKHLLHYDHCCT